MRHDDRLDCLAREPSARVGARSAGTAAHVLQTGGDCSDRGSRRRRRGGRAIADDRTLGRRCRQAPGTYGRWVVRSNICGQSMPEPWSASPTQSVSSWAFESSGSDTVAEITALYEASIARSEEVAGRCGSLDAIAAEASFGKSPVT